MRRFCLGVAGVVAGLLMAGCAAVGVGDVPPAAAAAANVAVARDFPGAERVLQGFELAGERALRNGDRVLYGVELARGDVVTRRLLRIEVARAPAPGDRGTLRFSGFGPAQLPDRVCRLLELEFTLFDVDGKELQRSRSDRLPDYFLQQSFIDGIAGAGQATNPAVGIASARLLRIVQLLESDPILKRLLAEVAPIPLDLRLLFRREVRLVPYFDRGSPVVGATADVLGERFPTRYELPFDLLLNDSVFVRLSATVVAPQGPTGAVAGIVLLRAQQAEDVTRQVRLQLLACARGADSEWQRSGMLITCGAADEGVALAFSPDGRWVAMPGEGGVVELRDLRAVDPTVPRLLLGAQVQTKGASVEGGAAPDGRSQTVGDLAFLDATTLLVAWPERVAVFDVADAGATGATLAPVATVATPGRVCALEVAPQRTCFVGLLGGEVQRWTWQGDLGAPAIEGVCAAAPVAMTLEGGATVQTKLQPPLGFLASGDDRDRCIVWRGAPFDRKNGKDFACVRDAAGVWHERELPPLPEGATQRERWRGSGGVVHGKDGVQKGGGFSGPLRGEFKLSAGDTVTLLGGPQGSRNLGLGHRNPGQIVHGFDPSGRFAAFVSPGYRLLIDCERAASMP